MMVKVSQWRGTPSVPGVAPPLVPTHAYQEQLPPLAYNSRPIMGNTGRIQDDPRNYEFNGFNGR